MEQPDDIEVMFPLLAREILYRLLRKSKWTLNMLSCFARRFGEYGQLGPEQAGC